MSRSPRISASGIKSGASKVLKFSIVLPMFLTIMFPLIYGFSMHSPQPHGMKIGIVGSDAQTQHLATKLDAQAGDAYDVTAVGSVDDAKHAIKSLDIRAAWDPKTNTEYVATCLLYTSDAADE